MLRAESFTSRFLPEDIQELTALGRQIVAEPYSGGTEDFDEKGYDPDLDPLLNPPKVGFLLETQMGGDVGDGGDPGSGSSNPDPDPFKK